MDSDPGKLADAEGFSAPLRGELLIIDEVRANQISSLC